MDGLRTLDRAQRFGHDLAVEFFHDAGERNRPRNFEQRQAATVGFVARGRRKRFDESRNGKRDRAHAGRSELRVPNAARQRFLGQLHTRSSAAGRPDAPMAAARASRRRAPFHLPVQAAAAGHDSSRRQRVDLEDLAQFQETCARCGAFGSR